VTTMSHDEWGPPDERGGAPIHESARRHHPNTTRHHPSGTSHPSGYRPPIGRYAAAWRHGFGHGFRDALRIAAQELPPETWGTRYRLADRYELAGSDG
jgi:hypothetical protein